MKAAILALLAAASVFGGPIPLTVLIGNSSVNFTPGTPNTLTFGDGGMLAGDFPASPVNVNWSITGTFDYNNSGTITGGNPGAFSFTAESGLDSLVGSISLANIVPTVSPANSATINGTLTLTSVSFGGADGTALESLLATDAGIPSILAGELFNLQISVHNCNDGPDVPCVGSVAAIGSGTIVTLTPGTSTPEPGSLILLGSGLVALLIAKRRWIGQRI